MSFPPDPVQPIQSVNVDPFAGQVWERIRKKLNAAKQREADRSGSDDKAPELEST